MPSLTASHGTPMRRTDSLKWFDSSPGRAFDRFDRVAPHPVARVTACATGTSIPAGLHSSGCRRACDPLLEPSPPTHSHRSAVLVFLCEVASSMAAWTGPTAHGLSGHAATRATIATATTCSTQTSRHSRLRGRAHRRALSRNGECSTVI